ncbi:ribosomal protein S18-alanine N-acetyltransferase [uncultured Microbacterium sp.]|uniref:ribosomal protein S18-alanine N-acetyltransferase n=1 Tax=uncultured Microbacterium sp. TaxID=191216 RepID=UPI0028D4BAAE|nr:ribosomal protein S18-alanine N-acetyltransferase [uncultured Microbacterium sp.]
MATRTATVSDLDAIMALENASFPTDAWSAAMMREELASPHGWYVVVEEAGRLVGYAGLRAVRGARDADVQTITISEAARGRGRGRALLRALLDEAVRRGVHDVFLEVRDDNPVAQKLYLSDGFAEVGRRPRYYQPDDVDAIVMQLDLRGWAARRAESADAAAPSAAESDRSDGIGSEASADPNTVHSPESATPSTSGKGWC